MATFQFSKMPPCSLGHPVSALSSSAILSSSTSNQVLSPPAPSAPSSIPKPPPFRYPETLGTLIAIRDSSGRGKGVFALVDIAPGTVLLCEYPLLILIDKGTRSDPLDEEVATISPSARKLFFALHHYSSNPRESISRSIVYSNGYAVVSDMHTGVFETASRINHSCVPNSNYSWVPQGDGESGRLMFWNMVKLSAGDEVTVSYGHPRAWLKKIYGFDCDCGGCEESAGTGNNIGKEEEAGVDDEGGALTVK